MLGQSFFSFLRTSTRSPQVAPLDLDYGAGDVSVPEPAAQDGCGGWGSGTPETACYRSPRHPTAGIKVSNIPADAFHNPSDGACTSHPPEELSDSNYLQTGAVALVEQCSIPQQQLPQGTGQAACRVENQELRCSHIALSATRSQPQ